jgi:hypothetical protein
MVVYLPSRAKSIHLGMIMDNSITPTDASRAGMGGKDASN